METELLPMKSKLTHHCVKLSNVVFVSKVLANVAIFGVSNIVGAYIHDRKLRALKTLFTDTYKCVIARLRMEDENEKLASSQIFDGISYN